MYLGQLSKKAKNAFWNLASNLVQDEYGMKAEEQEMLNSYLQEMGISQSDIPPLETAEQAVEALQAEPDTAKRIVFFELLGLAKMDSDYSEDEREKMASLQNALHLSAKTAQELETVLDEILQVYARAAKIVLEVS